MIVYDVRTMAEPVRHFQQYQDPALAHRAATRHAAALHASLVVVPIEDTAASVPAVPAAEATT